MSYGWVGRIGRVDLASGRCWIEPLPDDLRSGWLGGRGLGVALLKDLPALIRVLISCRWLWPADRCAAVTRRCPAVAC